MGDKQSRQLEPSGDEGAAAGDRAAEKGLSPVAKPGDGETLDAERPAKTGDASGGLPGGGDAKDPSAPDAAEPAAASAAAPAAAAGAVDGLAMPSEGEILARLIANLAQCPGHSMSMAEIRERLPPSLRGLAEDTENICKWLRGFPVLEVSGSPGQEQVTLTVGRIPRPAGSETQGSPGGGTAAFAAGRGDGAPSAGAEAGAPGGAAAGAAANAGIADDEEVSNPATVQLRGLPFRATIGDIKAFLGDHVAHLTTLEPPIRLLLNRDGRPSGFARVQFATAEGAQACREVLHRKPMGDRYVEVLACSDRSGRQRNRRTQEGQEVASVPVDAAVEYMERERVLTECREHMRIQDRHQLLLSMLGIALSQPARAYLRRANLGLKHFLARHPNEFRVEGPKGCERVIWCGPGMVDMSGFGPEAWLGPEPGTPKMNVTPNMAGGQSGGHLAATPSDWGTPGPGMANSVMANEAVAQAAGMDFGAGAWPYAPWAGTSWGWVPPWPHDSTDGLGQDGAAGGKAGKSEGSGSKSKRGGRSEAAPTRSHAHLHPQSHPFANRPAAAETVEPGAEVEDEQSGATVAALRLRGLPFSVTVQDVLAFFAQHDVADRIADGPQAAQLLPKANGRPSGQAVVQMRSRQDAEIAQKALYKQWIGGRYIEVFVYGGEGDTSNDGMPLPDEAVTAPKNPPNVNSMFQGDPHVDWMQQGMGANPWGALPWAGLVAPTPVAPGVGGDSQVDDPSGWASLFGSLWKGDVTGVMPPGMAAQAMPTTATVAPTPAPARPTLQV